MKYQKTIEKITSGSMSRSDLANIKKNAEEKFYKGDLDAKNVLIAINKACPADQFILFMGFCPDADANNRLDAEWKEKGICRFDFPESELQVNNFNTLYAGDRVVLKKIEKFGISMKLFGHGRVKAAAYDQDGTRYLIMNWSSQDKVIEVPLMGANSTVNIKSIEAVEDEMPEEFWHWLEE